MRRHDYAPILIALVATLSACETPFSTAVNGYDFAHDQQPASVVLSDPQVYSRETLINDRLVEIGYLEDVLDRSVNAVFEPQLRRDLQTLTGFVAQMNLLSDPVQGARIGREQDVLDRQHQRSLVDEEAALVRAQANLLAEQRRLEALQRGETVTNTGAPAGAASASPTTQQSTGETLPAAPAATNADAVSRLTLGEIQALLLAMEEVRGLMDLASVGDRARAADIRATPQELFRDRQAYREEIRAALADVNLDDGHDIEGNGLYRLQFRATVMPGEHRGQFAAARLTFTPPILSDRDVAEIYFAWLAYVNRELNAFNYNQDDIDVGLQAVGAYTGLFHTIEFASSGASSRFAVPQEAAEFLLWALCDPQFRRSQAAAQLPFQVRATGISDCPSPRPERPNRAFDLDAFSRAIGADELSAPVCPTAANLDQVDYAIDDILSAQGRPLLALSTIVTAAESGVGARLDRTSFHGLIDTLTREAAVGRQQTINGMLAVLATVRQRFNASACTDPELATRLTALVADLARDYRNIHAANPDYLLGRHFIATFRELLTQRQSTVAGEIATFFARPVDQSQRISSIQGAANAVDLALAMRAQMDGAGISGAFGANFVRQAVGRIETLERAPIVVGFNDREPDVRCGRSARADLNAAPACPVDAEGRSLQTYSQAGWIFGPTLQPAEGGARLTPMQNLTNHAVSIDLSAPGWWPWITARLDTAWIGDWGPGAQGNPFQRGEPLASRSFRVPLPHNAADMQALTQHVAGLGSPLTAPRIDQIIPNTVNLCPASTTLRIQVAGRNLWQGTEAYLNGVRAETVRVLPDMGGVDLQFPITNLPTTYDESAVLVIWTRDHRVRDSVTIRRLAADAPFCVAASAALTGVTVNRSWIASGSTFVLTVPNAAELARRHQLRVEMRRFDPETQSPLSAWMQLAVDTGANPSATVADRVISVQMPAAAVAGYPDGEYVQLSVVTLASATSADTRTLADRLVAYYGPSSPVVVESAGQASINAAESNFQVIVTLPRHPQRRFEGFPEAGAPNTAQLSVRGELPLNGVNYVYETAGAWEVINPAADGRPRYQAQVRLNAGTAATLVPALTANGQNFGFAVTVMGQRGGAGAINVKPRS